MREAAGLSQVDLARLAGVAPGTIGNIEAGTRKNPRELLALAAALKVMPEWLKSGRGQQWAPSSRPAAQFTEEAKKIAEDFDELPVDTHEAVELKRQVYNQLAGAIQLAKTAGLSRATAALPPPAVLPSDAHLRSPEKSP